MAWDSLVRETGNPDGKAQGDALFCSAQAGHQALRGLQKGEDHVPFRKRAPVGEYLVRQEEDRGPQDAEHGVFRIGLTPHQRDKHASRTLSIQTFADAQIFNFFLSQARIKFLLSFC